VYGPSTLGVFVLSLKYIPRSLVGREKGIELGIGISLLVCVSLVGPWLEGGI